MGIFESIIGIIAGFFKALPIFAKWFPAKTTEEKVEEAKQSIDDEMKKIEETGRP